MSTWIAINSMTDAPDHNCLVVFTDADGHFEGDPLDDLANIEACVGFLEWSKDHTRWTIIECGEIVYPHQVTAMCEIPKPVGIVAGKGAQPTRHSE